MTKINGDIVDGIYDYLINKYSNKEDKAKVSAWDKVTDNGYAARFEGITGLSPSLLKWFVEKWKEGPKVNLEVSSDGLSHEQTEDSFSLSIKIDGKNNSMAYVSLSYRLQTDGTYTICIDTKDSASATIYLKAIEAFISSKERDKVEQKEYYEHPGVKRIKSENNTFYVEIEGEESNARKIARELDRNQKGLGFENRFENRTNLNLVHEWKDYVVKKERDKKGNFVRDEHGNFVTVKDGKGNPEFEEVEKSFSYNGTYADKPGVITELRGNNKTFLAHLWGAGPGVYKNNELIPRPNEIGNIDQKNIITFLNKFFGKGYESATYTDTSIKEETTIKIPQTVTQNIEKIVSDEPEKILQPRTLVDLTNPINEALHIIKGVVDLTIRNTKGEKTRDVAKTLNSVLKHITTAAKDRTQTNPELYDFSIELNDLAGQLDFKQIYEEEYDTKLKEVARKIRKGLTQGLSTESINNELYNLISEKTLSLETEPDEEETEHNYNPIKKRRIKRTNNKRSVVSKKKRNNNCKKAKKRR